MNKIIKLMIISLILSSCVSTKIVVTELNTVGKVIKITNCKDCRDGHFIYKVELDPEEKDYITYITDAPYKMGEFIYFHTNIKKED